MNTWIRAARMWRDADRVETICLLLFPILFLMDAIPYSTLDKHLSELLLSL